jgi:hypothetical protein
MCIAVSFPHTHTLSSFHTPILTHSVPSAVLNTLAPFGLASKELSEQFERLVWKLRLIIESFRYFIENSWQFDNTNIQALHQELCAEEQSNFFLRLGGIDWYHYNLIFIYGILKFVFKEPIMDVEREATHRRYSILTPYYDHSDTTLDNWFPDTSWSLKWFRGARRQHKLPRSLSTMTSMIIGSPEVQEAIKLEIDSGKYTYAQAESSAKAICERMFADSNPKVLVGMSMFFRKTWRQLYDDVKVRVYVVCGSLYVVYACVCDRMIPKIMFSTAHYTTYFSTLHHIHFPSHTHTHTHTHRWRHTQ